VDKRGFYWYTSNPLDFSMIVVETALETAKAILAELNTDTRGNSTLFT
jgi:hypothetical protein